MMRRSSQNRRRARKSLSAAAQENAAAKPGSLVFQPTTTTVFSSSATATAPPRMRSCPISKARHSRRFLSQWSRKMRCSSATAAPPTASSQKVPECCTSRSMPVQARGRAKATTSKTSTLTSAASSAGWRHSKASLRGTWRATLAGAGSSKERETGLRPRTYWPSHSDNVYIKLEQRQRNRPRAFRRSNVTCCSMVRPGRHGPPKEPERIVMLTREIRERTSAKLK